MKNFTIVLAAGLVLFIFSGACFTQEKCKFKEEGYTQLFNEKDLTGWIIPDDDNGHCSVIDRLSIMMPVQKLKETRLKTEK